MEMSYPFLNCIIVYLLRLSNFVCAKPQPQNTPRITSADQAPGDVHAALAPREDQLSTVTRPGWTSTFTAFTFFTPSPNADPIPITSQSQIVTSYVPIVTICPFVASTQSPPYLAGNTSYNGQTTPSATIVSNYGSEGSALYRRQGAAATSAPFANSSVPTSYLTSCSVSYTPTTTQICHSTLTPLASPSIPITDCTQQVTFSTDHGYTLIPGNGTSTIQNLTTYYHARWDVIAGGVPTSQGIEKDVCSTGPSAGCSSVWEAWVASTVGVVLNKRC